MTVPRRVLLAGAAATAGLAACSGASSGGDSSPRPTLGATVANSRGTQVMPVQEFRADVRRCLDLGFTAVRIGCPYFLAGGVFGGRWTTAPTLRAVAEQVDIARSAGLAVWVTLTAPVEDPADRGLPRFLRVNREGTAAIAAALGPDVAGYQILNEWNTSSYRTNRGLAAAPTEAYLDEVRDFLVMAAEEIRSVAPAALCTSSVGGFPSNEARWVEWTRLYQRVGKGLGALGVNAYASPDDPVEQRAQGEWLLRMRGETGKPVVVLETGAPTPDQAAARQAETALPRSVQAFVAGGATAVFTYQLRDLQTGGPSREDVFGLYTTDGRLKPVGAAIRSVVRRPG